MLLKELEQVVKENMRKHPLFVRSLLKEHIQLYVLHIIYNAKDYKNSLVFMGGTCLRHFYGLPRLSEDLDFEAINPVDTRELAELLRTKIKNDLGFDDVRVSIHQRGKQILLKFPVLRKLGLADASESDLLYVKIDINPEPVTEYAQIEYTLKSVGNKVFVAQHYDLPTLAAKKIAALLLRNRLTGPENRATIKGRDYFDLIWFLENNVKVNLKHLRALLNSPTLTLQELKEKIKANVNEMAGKPYFVSDLKADLLPFIEDPNSVEIFAESFAKVFEGKVERLEVAR